MVCKTSSLPSWKEIICCRSIHPASAHVTLRRQHYLSSCKVMIAADQGRVALLGLLDISAAFDTVEHDILLRRLETSFGLTGSVISWLSSFLRGRTRQVIFNNLESTIAKVTSGVPQRGGLGPLLFLLYTADISVIAMDHNLGVHCYADDA